MLIAHVIMQCCQEFLIFIFCSGILCVDIIKMGNQLAATAPSQIFTVESYLADASEYTYDKSLGSTRFMKVARAKYHEGYTVVKVFVIPEQSMDLESYKSEVDTIKLKLNQASNCIPFQRTVITDRAALLVRQYAKHNLYDRISTRPFYNDIEKRWIAFQLLCALNQISQLGIYHGDIKSENVLITSWNWLLLTDFASFKPVYLPHDNPADFNYFFDTSRRRTCYIAPERFTDQPTSASGSNRQYTFERNNAEMHAMDIFSVGCVIAELFTEGHALFDLSQLLHYREKKFYPDACLSKIEDREVRSLVQHMIQLHPSDRHTADQYLTLWKSRMFPDHFYTFLKYYLGKFCEPPLMSPDQIVTALHCDMNKIKTNLIHKEGAADSLVLIASLLLSCVRSLKYVNCKLKALQLIVEYSRHLGPDKAEIILERFVPYLIQLVNDPVARVKAHALRALATCLVFVKFVPRGEANIFSEYILPGIDSCASDPSVPVRQAFSEKIAAFAEAALRFLDSSQLSSNLTSVTTVASEQVSYDSLLQPLISSIQDKVRTLMSDPDPNVRRSLLEFSVGRLCTFFGKQKANDVLLTHMITFLNDKQDWQLRASFFNSLVSIASYIGWQSSSILKTLIQQGLSDSQEFVVSQTLTALSCLVELGLLQKQFICELIKENISFLVHPCQWIRLKTVTFLCACASILDPIDKHCYILPALLPFLEYRILQIDQKRLVLNALRPQVKYSIYDLVYNAADSKSVFDGLKKRQTDRITGFVDGDAGEMHSSDIKSNATLRKLFLKEMSENDEEMLLHFEQFILRQQKSILPASSSSNIEWQNEEIADEGLISSSGANFTRRHADLITEADMTSYKVGQKKGPNRKRNPLGGSQTQDMKEEWKTMFGADASRLQSYSNVSARKATADMSITMSQLESAAKPIAPHSPEAKQMTFQYKCSSCKRELKELVHHKRDLYKIDVKQRELEEQADSNNLVAVTDWQPRGYLVAHMREHRGPIHRVAVSPSNEHFVTVSSDRTARLWEGLALEGKAVVNRSKASCHDFTSAIRTVAFCDDENFACASDDGVIYLISVDVMSSKSIAEKPESMPIPSSPIRSTYPIDTSVHGRITDLKSIVNSQLVAFTTSHGSIMALDIRISKPAWQLKHNLSQGLPTTFCLDPRQHWLCLGTASGVHVCWDLRFQLPITSFTHPSSAGIRRITTHPTQTSCIVSVSTGNNEIGIWDIETGTRQRALWASNTPPLSLNVKTADSINGLFTTIGSSGIRMYTGGTDGKIRLWDLLNAENSKIICGPETGTGRNHYTATYETKLIDGIHVIQEQIRKTKPDTANDTAQSPSDAADDLTAASNKSRPFEHAVPLHHHDVITDVALFHVNQTFLVSTARDGIVKVWK